MRAVAATLCILLLIVPPVRATTYYVDPTLGSDSNAGTSTGAPWQTLPGTRNSGSTGFLRSTWGAIDGTPKIGCGDWIYLRGGATHDSGAVWITPTFYEDTCTTSTRISIRVAPPGAWGASSGDFTFDGTGLTADCDSNYLPSDRAQALITVGGVDFVELLGASVSQRLIVRDVSDAGCITVGCSGPSCSGSTQGFRGDWWHLTSSYQGFSAGRLEQWQVSNVLVDLMESGGLKTGWVNDHIVDAGAFVNATVQDSGCGSAGAPGCTTSGGGDPDAFWFVGGRSLWCVNCTSTDNGERGANTGVIQDANMGGDFVYHFRNYTASGNGATCNIGGHNCSALGIDTSGNDWGFCSGFGTASCSGSAICNPLIADECAGGSTCTDVTGTKSRNIIVGAVLHDNKHGGEGAYGGGYQEVWHATSYDNGAGGGAQHRLRAENYDQRLLNSIDYGGGSYDAGTANGCEPQGQFTPTALDNCYRPSSSNGETLGASFTNGTAVNWPGANTYTSPPAWIGASNLVGLAACDPQFVNLAADDVTLGAASTAIDQGRFLMLTNGSGSGATSVTVQANGGGSDPRWYFISPASFLDAVADVIQIQDASCAAGSPSLSAGRAVVVSMTSSTITLDRACTWASGKGVHLPWNGAAPDMGAFESGSAPPPDPTPQRAAILLEVNPLP